MANRRMFSLDVVATDKFYSLPPAAQALYFALSMAADDDGFTASARRIVSICGCGRANLKLLEEQGYIIALPGSVIAITHWHVNNYLRSDRYRETNFKKEKAMLELTETTAKGHGGVYRLRPDGCHPVDDPEPQVRSGKVREGKDREGKGSSVPETAAETDTDTRSRNNDYYDLSPSPEKITAYAKEHGYVLSNGEADRFLSYNKLRGWTVGQKSITDWRSAFDMWMKKGKEFENDGKNRVSASVLAENAVKLPYEIVL